jgi:hypothetical protein
MAKAKKKTAAPIDTSAGSAAYALAVLHQAELTPRIPAGTVSDLAADLTLLGASPNPPAPPAPGAGPAPPAPPTLAELVADAVALTSAVHDAIHGANATPAVRKAYGVSSKVATKEPKAVIAEAEKILAQAQANPTEALALGILPADTTALGQTLSDLKASEAATKTKGGVAGVTAKERRAAETRMHEATARIAGAGILAFAKDAVVRATFEAIKPKKKA